MNALPNELLRRTAELSAEVTRPIPGSRKVQVASADGGFGVPMREILQSDTPLVFGAEANPPLAVYDTSGPYTDPAARIDLTAGLAPLRAEWIAARGDSESLPDLSSEFGRRRATDPEAGGGALPAHAGAASRSGRRQRHADALCAARDRHAGDGIHRDPREPAP